MNQPLIPDPQTQTLKYFNKCLTSTPQTSIQTFSIAFPTHELASNLNEDLSRTRDQNKGLEALTHRLGPRVPYGPGPGSGVKFPEKAVKEQYVAKKAEMVWLGNVVNDVRMAVEAKWREWSHLTAAVQRNVEALEEVLKVIEGLPEEEEKK